MFCTRCGFLNAAGAQFCAACGAPLTVSASVPAAAPPSGPQPGSSPPTPAVPPARLGDRFLAVVLDSFLMAAAFAVIGMWAASRWGGFTAEGFSLEGRAAWVAGGATLVLGLLYYWIAEGLFGASLGKAIIGLAVRKADGGPCGLGASLIRNLLRLVDGLGVYLVGFLAAVLSRSRQRIGDMAARTVVLERPSAPAARVALVLLWLAAIAAGVFGAMRLHRAPAAAPGAVTAAAGAPAPAAGDLRLINLGFLEREDGPPRRQGPYQRGELVYLKYDIVGFGTAPEGNTNLRISGRALDPNGLPLYGWSREFNRAIAPGNPVNGWVSIELPAFVPPGRYQIQIQVEDQVKNARLTQAVGFDVQGEPVPVASRFQVRDFEMAPAKDGPATSPLVLEGGGTVYMRWKIAGLQFRGDDLDVRVAMKVYGPGGKLLLDQPEYFSRRESVGYHPPGYFLPISGHLNVPSGFDKGTYTAQFEAFDNIAQARTSWSGQFQVR